jgi:CDGSH-type Zn-finger protein/truncated hemoglobin YjbI
MDASYDPETIASQVRDLVRGALDLDQVLAAGGPVEGPGGSVDPRAAARTRLQRSVVRPLRGVLDELGAAVEQQPEPSDEGTVADRAWALAEAATRLRLTPGVPLGVVEATAALQELCCTLAPDEAPRRRAALADLQGSLPPAIQVQTDGPYLVTNPQSITIWLVVETATMPQMALCRCGESASKPICDGSHASSGFTGNKDPHRVPDRRDSYVGEQVTIHDNRGLCAHSGFCTDRLATVFRAGTEPFVAPSGGRMGEIIRAVRACPSGALSVSLGGTRSETETATATEAETDAETEVVIGTESRELVDQEREPTIEVSRDGPYRITGTIPLHDADGTPVPHNAGASLEHYSLCRCGHSQNKPFCSGMHWYVAFHDPPASDEPSLFEWAGGFPALLRMTRLFYGKHVPQDPLLAPLFADMSPDHPERVAAWLGETFGGPKAHTEGYGGYDRMVSQHAGKALTEEQRARWAQLILRSADEARLPTDPEFRAAFVAYIEWGSRIAVENSAPGAHPPQHMPVPRWGWVADATPWSRQSALAPEDGDGGDGAGDGDQAVPLPGPDEPVDFDAHVKPLFRPKDRQSMRFAFDLWSHDDVVSHGQAILEQLKAGTMPCDGAWPADRVDVFERWLSSNTPS